MYLIWHFQPPSLEFSTSIEVLKHLADAHISSFDETINNTIFNSEKRKDNKREEADINDCEIEKGKFRCAHCKKNVPNEDTFDIHKENSQKMCQFCTMATQYD